MLIGDTTLYARSAPRHRAPKLPPPFDPTDPVARARVEGTRRVGRLLMPDLALTVQGEKIVASFTLTKGAYATVVMRELMKVEDDHLSVISEDDE